MKEFPEANWPEWEIERKIGSGSFGSVYSIVREENGFLYRDALKVVNIPKSEDEISSLEAGGMDAKSISEYCRSNALKVYNEINTLILLGGVTNIVNYKDHKMVPREDGIGYRIFIRMELLEPLKEYRKKHGMDLAAVMRMGTDLARALEYCESQNIIHRDIKPDNIFVSNNGDFKLGDFGTARYMQSMNFGTIAGTFNYMAPEVYSHQPYDLRADIYSLGMVLYQYLSRGLLPFIPQGKRVLDADDVERAFTRRIQGEKIPEIPNIDPALSAVITHALEYDPARRFSSSREFRMALENPTAWYNGILRTAAGPAGQPIAGETVKLVQGSAMNRSGVTDQSTPAPISTMLVCKTCGKPLNPGASFCRHCGTKVSILDLPPEKPEEKKKSWLPVIIATAAGAALLIGLIVGLVIYFTGKDNGEGENNWTLNDLTSSETQDSTPAPSEPDSPATSEQEDPNHSKESSTAPKDDPVTPPVTDPPDEEPETVPLPAVNDIILFGHFEQDNNTGNGGEEIRWQVIDVDEEGRRVLLLSEYSLENIQFDAESESQNWENSSLRRWLNGAFYSETFSDREKAIIEPVSIFDTYTFVGRGASISDRVFCLSKSDVEKLLPYPADRIAKNSDFAQAEMKRKMLTSWFYPNTEAEVESTVAGWESLYGVHCSWWWLRDPAGTGVTAWGEIRADQVDRRDLNSVRPVVWINWDLAFSDEIDTVGTQEYDLGGFGAEGGRQESVSLTSLSRTDVSGKTQLIGQCTDINGNIYYNVLAGGVSEFNNIVDYSLGGKYSTLSGRVIRDGEVNNGRLANPDRTDIVLSVYGDGVLLYQSVSVNLANGALQDFSVNVEGIELLRIVINGMNFIRLCNALLTEK